MVTLWKKLLQTKCWSLVFSKPDRWEAPDQNFIGHRDIVTRSLARYHFIASHLHGVALDIGCGRGCGFNVIEPRCTANIGVDISHDFLQEAQDQFPTIPLVCASGDALPFSRGSFDSIIAFEVIEHIENDLAFLNELRRLARDNAFIAISTPNRFIASGKAAKPVNRFHTREYTSIEFHRLLSQVFSSVALFGQYDRTISESTANDLVNAIPIRFKYLIPEHIQCLISVAIRPKLLLDECIFQEEDIENAHTFVALCRP